MPDFRWKTALILDYIGIWYYREDICVISLSIRKLQILEQRCNIMSWYNEAIWLPYLSTWTYRRSKENVRNSCTSTTGGGYNLLVKLNQRNPRSSGLYLWCDPLLGFWVWCRWNPPGCCRCTGFWFHACAPPYCRRSQTGFLADGQ